MEQPNKAPFVEPGTRQTKAAGLYLHIPFCRQKCSYCDFFSSPELALKKAFVAALRQEIEQAAPLVPAEFNTIYIGGGTPSLLTVKELTEIMEAVYTHFNICATAQITVEINPDSAESSWLAGAHQAGVNRLNIGVQSFNDERLSFLGRIHSAAQARQAIDAARKSGFTNLGLDIIYGLPGQNQIGLIDDLEQALSYFPEHISCYMLTYESETPLEKYFQDGGFKKLSEQNASSLFTTTSEFLTGQGYLHYEISSFAKSEAYRSRHNSKYWRRTPYLGLGPGAHSYDGHSHRSWNKKKLNSYINRLSEGQTPLRGSEILNRYQQMIEAIYLGWRQAEGISLGVFKEEFGVDLNSIIEAVQADYARAVFWGTDKTRCSLTLSGWLFHEALSAEVAARL